MTAHVLQKEPFNRELHLLLNLENNSSLHLLLSTGILLHASVSMFIHAWLASVHYSQHVRGAKEWFTE